MEILKILGRKLVNSKIRIIAKIGQFLKSIFLDIRFFVQSKPYLNDRKQIERDYKKRFGVLPDLDNPKNFNEKNNWRKLYDRKDIYTLMVDKVKIKEIVQERLGSGYTIPLIGVWNSASEIDFSKLPSKYVLKTNHAGGVIVCRDNTMFDFKKAVNELNYTLRRDYYLPSREWPYKNVDRKVLCEQYMGENLTDYKNYCFNGKLLYTLVWDNHSREDGRKPQAFFCGAYDRDWQKTDMRIDYPSDEMVFDKPSCYEEMVRVAEIMSKDIPFVRVDCYIIDNRVYLGEMTFFPWGGYQKFKDEKWNDYLGKLEILNRKE